MAAADAGMGIVQEIVSNSEPPGLGWLFRPLPTADFGIDCQLEVVKRDSRGERRATGRILSAQVKTGPSYFSADNGDHWLVRIKRSTVAYWRSHSVPVLLILVNPSTRGCYWARGDADDLIEFKTTYGIAVPKSQMLDVRCATMLEELAANAAPAGRRLAALDGAAPWMEALKRGERLYVNVDHWVNKSSQRMDVSIGSYVQEEEKIGSHAFIRTHFKPLAQFGAMGFGSWRELVRQQFPWATLTPDEVTKPDEDDLYDMYLAEYGTWDSEDHSYYDFRGEFADYLGAAVEAWRHGLVGDFGNGEVIGYRMELKLNRLGRSFLRVHRYLQRGPNPAGEG